MKNYTMVMNDGRKTHFRCAPSELREFTERLIRIYEGRGLNLVSMPKEVK